MKQIAILLSIVFLFSATSCTKKDAADTTTDEQQSMKEGKVEKMEKAIEKAWKAPEKPTVDPAKKYQAIIKTEKGDITCDLYVKEAPLSVTNFKYLADNDFYNGLTFHRVVPDFVIQGGDPDGTGAGGPGYTIPAEINKKHIKGALAWARTGDEVNPERRSSGSQFYITYKPTPFLDDQYTVFGETTDGMDVVNKIAQGDKIIDVVVVEK